MSDTTRPIPAEAVRDRDQVEAAGVNAAKPDLEDPRVVLALLEADQVVAAKRQTHFGRRNFSFGTRILLWGLRVYVVVMLVIVFISAFRAIRGLH
jgi:hypothetical protein